MDSFLHEDDGLWDELDHHQTKEIMRHHRDVGIQGRPFSSAEAHVLSHQTHQELRRFSSVFYHAASSAWKEQKTIQRMKREARQSGSQRVSTNSYLADFGIPRNGDPMMMRDEGFEDQRAQNDFIFLPKFRFRPENDGLAIVSNLDLYFQSLYHYFYNRGLVPIICKGFVELATLLLTLGLSVCLFVYVDWRGLSTCTDENTCRQDLGSYVIKRPFQSFTWWNTTVILYCLIFLAYTGLSVLSFIQTVQDALNAKWVYEERLGISSRKLIGGAVDWDRDVVSKLMDLQRNGEYRIAIHNNGQNLDALVIANRILRKENFLVALFNRGLLDLRPPFSTSLVDTCFCSTLEWSIYWCVLGFMFNHKYELRPAFYLDPTALRRRFRLCGLAHLVLMPFLLFFVTAYFGLQNAYDWKSTKQYLGPREWSQPAKWLFREFNELPHVFERRLEPSYEAAERYLSLFGSNEFVAALGRILVFVGGSFGAILFAFAAMNDAILLHVKVANWNLLWFAGVFGVIYSGGKALIPKPEAQPKSARNLYAEIDDALSKVANHTHYYPETWKGRGWDQETNRAFNGMFKYKAKLFVSEFLSLVFAPYILYFSLANCAEAICEFVIAAKAEIPGAGDVCGYATFDFASFDDERWDNHNGQSQDLLAGSLAESIMQSGNIDEARRSLPKPKSKLSKMTNSYENFKNVHPSWTGSTVPNANPVGGGVFAAEGSTLLRREREPHRLAAERQLETLEELERGEGRGAHELTAIHEGYIPYTPPHAENQTPPMDERNLEQG